MPGVGLDTNLPNFKAAVTALLVAGPMDGAAQSTIEAFAEQLCEAINDHIKQAKVEGISPPGTSGGPITNGELL